MIYAQEIATGRELEINNVKLTPEGRIIGRWDFGTRFYKKYGCALECIGHDGELPILALRDGWAITGRTRRKEAKTDNRQEESPAQAKERTPRERYYMQFKAKHPDTVLLFRCGDFYEAIFADASDVAQVLDLSVTHNAQGDAFTGFPARNLDNNLPQLIRAGKRVAICDDMSDEPWLQAEQKQEQKQEEEQATTTPATCGNVDATAAAIAAALKGLQVQAKGVDADEVRAIVREEVAAAMEDAEPTAVAIKVADGDTVKVEGAHPLLPRLLALVANDRVIGRFPWLFGPAGSGKSTLAKQVAEALQLPFYSVSSLQQKYELEGYADASGQFVETAFYKAFAHGGVFCFDEASTSPAEVQVAFNTALAQLRYCFPVVGMVEAHPDFHVIAADNTRGRGASAEYTARYELDASTLDRYTFLRVDYTDAHDLAMANGDAALVDFIRDVRQALKDANLTYLASPRASRAIKALQAIGMAENEALSLGLCSGWDEQDVRTIAAKVKGGKTPWHEAFEKLAANL